jgi:5-methylcytosine-specific restriction protein A
LDEEIVINPDTDLIPVCSNYHRIIHRKKVDVLSAEEVKTLIIRARAVN